ncbi:DUF6297 family protein [Arachnia propionica]|uniref:ABC transporter permease n=1 Tax=Arachnia propionica TaxID=1750 RepID=A0A3P1WW67_9ACTN|nr:DUF6297 family protein [Arachnia propionica]RRD49997.1 ABC transporter permease [Arachnia propionica]
MSDRFGEIGRVDERQLRLLVRDWRHGRADRNILQALSDAYVMVFALVLIGAMLVSSILQAQRTVAVCDTDACLASRGLLPWAATAAFLTLALVAARMFGPVIASAAEGFWILDGDVDRRRFLKGRLVAAVVLALLVGGGLGALVAALVGADAESILIWAAAAGLGCFGLVAFAAAEQALERRWIMRGVIWLTGVVAFVALAMLVLIATGTLPARTVAALGVDFAWIVVAVGAVLGVGSLLLAWARLSRLRRQRLVAGSSLAAGLQGAAFALDLALVRDILVDFRFREQGHVRPTRGSGSGLAALVMRDVQRLWRNPRPLVFWIVSMLIPYAVQALGLGVIASSLSALVLMAALIGFCNSMRVLTRTKGLQRCFPFAPGAVRQATMVVPAVLALLWAVATTPAFLGVVGGTPVDVATGVGQALLTAAAGLLAAVRWVTAKPANYGGPLVATTGFGALPPGLMFSLIKGVDIVAVVTLPIVLGWPAWLSVSIALIVFFVLRSGFDQQTLMEQHEEQQRLLAEEKARRAGTVAARNKVKVQRRR